MTTGTSICTFYTCKEPACGLSLQAQIVFQAATHTPGSWCDVKPTEYAYGWCSSHGTAVRPSYEALAAAIDRCKCGCHRAPEDCPWCGTAHVDGKCWSDA